MEELLEILQELRPDVDFENTERLVTDRVIQSFDVVALVAEIDDAFDVKVKPADLLPENFDSVEAMWALIQRLQDEEY